MERLGGAVTAQMGGAGGLGDEGRVARYRRACRGMDRGQFALSLAAGRKSVSAQRRRIATLRICDILEGDGALDVFAGEHDRVLPLYEYPDIRRGHGRRAGGAGGGRFAGGSSGATVQRHGGCQVECARAASNAN